VLLLVLRDWRVCVFVLLSVIYAAHVVTLGFIAGIYREDVL